MSKTNSLKAVLAIAIFGLLFSGYLTYKEFFVVGVGTSCPVIGSPGTVFGYPPCVYGFVMYLAVTTIAFLGLRSKDR